MSGKFVPIQIPPGVVANATKQMRSSNWSEVNLVRWIEGELQPVGGQSQYAYTFASRCKAIHGWYDLAGGYHVAYVCEQHVYVDTAGQLSDITPVGGWPAPPLPGAGGYGDLNYGDDTYGSPRASGLTPALSQLPNVWTVSNFGAVLLVMYSADGRLLQCDPSALVNDVQTIHISGTPGGGFFQLIFDGQTTAQILWNATAAQMATALQALPNVGASGVTVTGGTSLPLGPLTVTFVGPLAGKPQPLLIPTGVVMTGGGPPAPVIVHTTTGGVTKLIQVPATAGGVAGKSPKGRCFVVTQERFVVIFGMNADGTVDGGGARRFGWCDQENLGAWDFTNVTSQAGFLDVEPASPIVCATSGKFGTLFFTADKAYVSRYLGLPYVYNYVELADEATPWSPASIVSTSSSVVWMAKSGAFSFDGSSISPVACLVRPWVTDDVDIINVREQACAVHVGDFTEVWWFFPQKGQPYNTRAIFYNYKEGWWSQARMARSAGITSSYVAQTIMADGTVAFQHETGLVYGHAEPPWAETFDLNLTSGARLVTLKQVIPDLKGDMLNVQFSFYWKNSRSIGAPGQWTTPKNLRPDGYVDARTTGRGLRMKLSCVGPQITPFTVGQHLVDFAIRGDR